YFDQLASTNIVLMDYEETNRTNLTFDYLYERLIAPYGSYGGHLYVILEGDTAVHHAVVVYGLVREDVGDFVGIMDPLRGVLAAPTLEYFRMKASDFLVGWKKH